MERKAALQNTLRQMKREHSYISGPTSTRDKISRTPTDRPGSHPEDLIHPITGLLPDVIETINIKIRGPDDTTYSTSHPPVWTYRLALRVLNCTLSDKHDRSTMYHFQYDIDV